MSFKDLASFEPLKKLSRAPIDLSVDGAINEKRIEKLSAENLGFKLLYATERVSQEVMEKLFSLAQEAKAIEKMHAMQEGKVINYIEGFESEKRTVLHTAMRDFFENPVSTMQAKEAASLALAELKKLELFIKKIDKKFDAIVQIGIGGSYAGPRAIYEALKAYQEPNKKVFFIVNVDPDEAAFVLKQVDLKKTLFVSVSKSGTTIETLSNEEFVRDHLKKAGLNPKDHIVAITGKKSPMDDPSKYLESFYIWDYVGGRFSATSMVGGVMLSFALGIDNFKKILQGANKVDKSVLSKDVHKNLPLLDALLGIWNRNFLFLDTLAIIPYSAALSYLILHLEQCDMESNGKSVDQMGKFIEFYSGPIVFGDVGTNAQHSFFQFLHQGTGLVATEFIGFRKTQYSEDFKFANSTMQDKLLANLFAQSLSLAVGEKSSNYNKLFLGNHPNHILLSNQLDPFTMGALISHFEHKIAFQGFIWGINSFDQEGVQLGKKLANKMLDHLSGKKEFGLAKAYLKHLESFSK
ncbi:MAG: glucose-6-phosphate isomerase [Chlamydiae bacterium]|nr:glucose-6-phosphate isomerase [Chlamydiota bacterium]